METEENFEVYFWLGADLNLESVLREDFFNRIREEREMVRRWAEVDISNVN